MFIRSLRYLFDHVRILFCGIFDVRRNPFRSRHFHYAKSICKITYFSRVHCNELMLRWHPTRKTKRAIILNYIIILSEWFSAAKPTAIHASAAYMHIVIIHTKSKWNRSTSSLIWYLPNPSSSQLFSYSLRILVTAWSDGNKIRSKMKMGIHKATSYECIYADWFSFSCIC